jgi:hypothetical protein
MAFPNNPSNGDTFVRYGRTYQYDSTMLMWKVLKSGILLEELADIDITTNPPTAGDALLWSGSTFEPGAVGAVKVYQTNLPLSGNSAGDIAYVTDLSRLYMFTGVGWFNIALINTNPTITTGPDGSYTFAFDGTPTVITLVAEDPEGLPITWSYAVTTGSLGTTATVAQADNVFTITPSTNSADQGNFGITFTASDGVNLATTGESSFTLAFNVPIEYLVIAGGGGGASGGGGGGGAGGLLFGTASVIENTSYTITVGAGGAGGVGVNLAGLTGGGSSISGTDVSVNVTGGGGGGKPGGAPTIGGSGGGAGRASTTGASGIAGQGYAGGNTSGNDSSAGGGGAGGVGQDKVSVSTSGAGGIGVESSITGTATYYAGGGGGSGYSGAGATTPGAGGLGGGGSGGALSGNGTGISGTAYTGGGGGAGSYIGGSNSGGAGGSGIVIIRYLGTTKATGGTITSNGGYTIHTFTSSGVFQLDN